MEQEQKVLLENLTKLEKETYTRGFTDGMQAAVNLFLAGIILLLALIIIIHHF